MEERRDNSEALIKAAERVAEDVKRAAEVVRDAVKTADLLRMKAASDAADLLLHAKEENTKKLANALREVFGEQEESQRFIDTKRIPLICKDISNINKSLEDLHDKLDRKFVTKESFDPVKSIIYGLMGVMGIATLTAIIRLVIK